MIGEVDMDEVSLLKQKLEWDLQKNSYLGVESLTIKRVSYLCVAQNKSPSYFRFVHSFVRSLGVADMLIAESTTFADPDAMQQ